MKKTHVAMLVISTVLWLIVGLAPVFVIPVFAAMFADFGAALPAPTRLVIALSSITKSWVGVYLPVFTILFIGYLAVITDQNKRSYRLWFFWSGMLSFLSLLIVLFLPILELGTVAKELK